MAPMDRANMQIITIQLEDLSTNLGDWTARSGPLYVRLADAIGDAHSYGLLADVPGAGAAMAGDERRLPAERQLASHLGVSRGTVVAAYELLSARGQAHTRRGSGTWLGA